MRGSSEIFAAKMSLHVELSAAEKAALLAMVTRPQTSKAGSPVAAVGDPLDTATVVLDGLLARTKQLPDGRRQILAILIPGDLVDVHASVLRQRDDQLEAISTATVAVIPQSRIAGVAAEFPRLHEAFLREAFIEAAIAREWVLNIGRRTALEGMAHLLCELIHRWDAVGLSDGGKYPFPLKQQHLADCLGLSTIHVNRVVQQLRSSGLIELERRSLSVLKRQDLQRLADFTPGYLHVTGAKAA